MLKFPKTKINRLHLSKQPQQQKTEKYLNIIVKTVFNHCFYNPKCLFGLFSNVNKLWRHAQAQTRRKTLRNWASVSASTMLIATRVTPVTPEPTCAVTSVNTFASRLNWKEFVNILASECRRERHRRSLEPLQVEKNVNFLNPHYV